MKFIFGMHINIEVFYKLILSSWVCATRHTQSTQDKRFASSQYLQKSMGVEVDLLPANEHKNFRQVDSITLGLHSQTCPKYPKQVYNIFVISRKT